MPSIDLCAHGGAGHGARNQLHDTTRPYSQIGRAISELIESSVSGDAVDLSSRHADIHKLPITQVVQGVS